MGIGLEKQYSIPSLSTLISINLILHIHNAPHEDDDADTSSVHKDDIRESVMRSLDTIESEDAPLPPSAIEAHHDTEKKRKLAGPATMVPPLQLPPSHNNMDDDAIPDPIDSSISVVTTAPPVTTRPSTPPPTMLLPDLSPPVPPPPPSTMEQQSPVDPSTSTEGTHQVLHATPVDDEVISAIIMLEPEPDVEPPYISDPEISSNGGGSDANSSASGEIQLSWWRQYQKIMIGGTILIIIITSPATFFFAPVSNKLPPLTTLFVHPSLHHTLSWHLPAPALLLESFARKVEEGMILWVIHIHCG